MYLERQKCRACLKAGISCESRGWFDVTVMRGVSSVIKREGSERNFECLQSIENCPVIQGGASVEETAGKIKSVINRVSEYIVQPVLVSRSSSEIKTPGVDS